MSSALLAAVTSQGVPLGGSLWYVNYSAILVIVLTAVAVVLSYLSTTVSHSYCETIFLTIYTPASQLFNATITLRDTHPTEGPDNQPTSQQCAPSWFKQLLFACIVLASTQGLTITAVAYATCMTLVYSGLSAQLKKCSPSKAADVQKAKLVVSAQDQFTIAAMLLSVAADMYVCQSFGVMNAMYFILTDKTTVAAIKGALENRNIEVMEGLEQYYTEGLVHLAEIALTVFAAVTQPCVCLLYIPVCYFCVFQPMQQFRVNVKAINAESLCLSNFEKASVKDISEYDDVCAVCLCAMAHARITPCKHMFHGKCLKDCLKKKNQCPMCNYEML